MNTLEHTVSPEEVMAYIDGELSPIETRALAAHLEHCPACARLVRDFGETSAALANWTVPEPSAQLENSVLERAEKNNTKQSWPKLLKGFAKGGAVAFAALLLLVGIGFMRSAHQAPSPMNELSMLAEPDRNYADARSSRSEPRAEKQMSFARQALKAPPSSVYGLIAQSKPSDTLNAAAHIKDITALEPIPAPMIARKVTLDIVVKNLDTARATIDTILARHAGFSGDVHINTAADSDTTSHTYTGSLRIPASDLAAAITELRALGRVRNETQTGEEVGEQHADLEARLKNSRETEDTLRAILQKRTGKVSDILEVEEEIARVRGEIEQMQADQQGLEHRVTFATVDVDLTELQPNASAPSTAKQLSDALKQGLHNAADSITGLLIFFAEYGLSILFWLLLIGLPAAFAWHRYRRIRSQP